MEKYKNRVMVKKAMQTLTSLLLCCTIHCACNTPTESLSYREETLSHADSLQFTTIADIPLPEGYVRIKDSAHSITTYYRSLPLKANNTVYLYNGEIKPNQDAQYAVLNMDVGDKDLQQCADAAMRLYAEYQYQLKNYDLIKFQFSNGFICDYNHYAKGYRLNINNNKTHWIKSQEADYSYQTFRKYLDLVYSYAGTFSLNKQMQTIPFHDIRPGKVLLQSQQPYGHAVTIMDMAVHISTQDTIFLLSQSYMPAQDIHIIKNPIHPKLSPWYSVRNEGVIRTPEWTFYNTDLKSF
jgi:hypothetical protein